MRSLSRRLFLTLGATVVLATFGCSQGSPVAPRQAPPQAPPQAPVAPPASSLTTLGGTYVGQTPGIGLFINGIPVFTGSYVLTLTGERVTGSFYYAGDFGGTVDGTLHDVASTAPFGKLTLHLSEVDGDFEIDADVTTPDGSAFSGTTNPCYGSDCSASFTRR